MHSTLTTASYLVSLYSSYIYRWPLYTSYQLTHLNSHLFIPHTIYIHLTHAYWLTLHTCPLDRRMQTMSAVTPYSPMHAISSHSLVSPLALYNLLSLITMHTMHAISSRSILDTYILNLRIQTMGEESRTYSMKKVVHTQSAHSDNASCDSLISVL